MTFFHRFKILNFPLFSLKQYISFLFREHQYFPSTFLNLLPHFVKCVFTYFTCFSFLPPPSLTMMHLWRTGHKYRLKDLYLTDVSMQRVLAEGNLNYY